MKKKIIIIICIILVAASVLFIPVPGEIYRDGGTREYKALTYKMVKWNRIYEGDLCYNMTRFYFGKDKRKSIDELWAQIAPSEPVTGEISENTSDSLHKTFEATVIEVNDTSVLVKPAEGSDELNSADRIIIPLLPHNEEELPQRIKATDIISVEYDGNIAETYPAQIDTVYCIKVIASDDSPDNVSHTEIDISEKTTVTISPVNNPNFWTVLSDKDAETVFSIISGQKNWTFSYDNISDIAIEYGNKKCYYDTGSGIITASDNKAVKLKETDREKMNSVFEKCRREWVTEKPIPVIAPGDPKKEPDSDIYRYNSIAKVHYVRTDCMCDTKTYYPCTVVIKSRKELEDYRNDNKNIYDFGSEIQAEKYDSGSFSDVIKKYDEKFFENNALIFVRTQESSGSIFYRFNNINGNTINITKYVPEVCTCDVANWHIIIETEKTNPIIGQKINVNITEEK